MTTTGTSLLDNLRYIIRQFNKWILNPVTLAFAGRRWSPHAVVRHVGRRTGRTYATPVVAASAEDSFVIPLAYGETVDWLRNVLLAGGCTIEWKGRAYKVTDPRVIGSSTALPSFSIWHRVAFRLFGIHKFLSVRRPSLLSEESAISR